jgi:hypothetical protein
VTATRRFARPQSFAAIVAGLIDPTPHPVYRNVVMRSALETDLARHLDNSGVAWRYEPMIFGDYLPDFEIVAVDPPTFIEVKPTLREVPRAKKRMAVIWRSHPTALLVVACAEGSRWFGAIAGGKWTPWVERWAHA